jgi:hypothetical protein
MCVSSVRCLGAAWPNLQTGQSKKQSERDILKNGEFATCDQNEIFSRTGKSLLDNTKSFF